MKKTSIKTSFEPQFEYWSLIWMFHAEKSNSKINLTHENALTMIYNDSLFEEFLKKDSSFTVHHFNIAWPAIESFKVSNNIGPTLLMTYLQDLIITTTFAQNLILLFQVWVRFIIVKILYSVTVPLSGILYWIT